MATTPWALKGVTDDERARITKLAKQQGLLISRFIVGCCLRAEGEPITVVNTPGGAPESTPDGDARERLERLIRLAGEAATGTPAHRTAMRALSRLIRAELASVLPAAPPGRPLPRLTAPEAAE